MSGGEQSHMNCETWKLENSPLTPLPCKKLGTMYSRARIVAAGSLEKLISARLFVNFFPHQRRKSNRNSAYQMTFRSAVIDTRSNQGFFHKSVTAWDSCHSHAQDEQGSRIASHTSLDPSVARGTAVVVWSWGVAALEKGSSRTTRPQSGPLRALGQTTCSSAAAPSNGVARAGGHDL
eukprot:354704-Chlamydomonas_euryale.AAC.2